jgi:hypothetical protein
MLEIERVASTKQRRGPGYELGAQRAPSLRSANVPAGNKTSRAPAANRALIGETHQQQRERRAFGVEEAATSPSRSRSGGTSLGVFAEGEGVRSAFSERLVFSHLHSPGKHVRSRGRRPLVRDRGGTKSGDYREPGALGSAFHELSLQMYDTTASDVVILRGRVGHHWMD